MRISEQSQLLSKKEIWVLLLIPGICHFLFPGIWIDFFLLALFYISIRCNVQPYFYFIFIWGIIYFATTFDNPGREIFALGVIWYFLSSFKFETDITKIVSCVVGCIIYVVVKFCINFEGCVWSIPVTIIFAIYFILIHTVISLIMVSMNNAFKSKLPIA